MAASLMLKVRNRLPTTAAQAAGRVTSTPVMALRGARWQGR